MERFTKMVPVVPLRGLVVFPGMLLHFDAGRERTVAALEAAMETDSAVFLVAQKDARKNALNTDDMNEYGTLAKIKQILKLPGSSMRVLVEGVARGRMIGCTVGPKYFIGEVEPQFPAPVDEVRRFELEALRRRAMEAFEEYLRASGKLQNELLLNVQAIEDPHRFADTIAETIAVKIEQRQALLECLDPLERLVKVITIANDEVEIIKADKRIAQEVKNQVERAQKEYYLREQVKAIQNELGEGEESERDELEKQIEASDMTDEARDKAKKELARLTRMPGGSHEGTVVRTYLDWLLALPWRKHSEDNLDTKNARRILDEDHYGLDKVKERVIEYLAVCKLKGVMRGPILCFVGPPGVGKTSVASSIAKATGRKFVRMSLGGVRDEAEIRGHRRTYIGAIPGRIINAMKQAGTMNPLILLDEIDKLGNDFRGDPASALLEVLDGAQNFAFRDHYLEVPYDLSDVMFITTANSLDTIPRPLLDRMEVIQLPSYTAEEKLQIAKRHLLPKQLEEHALSKRVISVQEQALSDIINMYTAEAGVRQLERLIAAVCRKAACEIAQGKKSLRVTPAKVKAYLGAERYKREPLSGKDEVGICNGLAVTGVGGEMLTIEVTVMEGTGQLTLTGQLGDVMQESAKAAVSYIRAHAARYGIEHDFYKTRDIHLHVPAGATPKDGPSAGITIATAIISALTGAPVRGDVAMTGEVTLRGRVLPIGGLKEKLYAAQRAGVSVAILPEANRADAQELPESIKRSLKLVLVETLEQVFETALTYVPAPAKNELPLMKMGQTPPPPQDAYIS